MSNPDRLRAPSPNLVLAGLDVAFLLGWFIVFRKTYYEIRWHVREAWYELEARIYAAYDGVRDFLVMLEEETRPQRKAALAPRPVEPERRDRVAYLPPDLRVYAIGDIHGRADLLKRLMARIEADAEAAPESRHALVFLGDYVDRGFQSRDVLDFLAEGDFSGFETHFLKGNHEAAFAKFLAEPEFGPEWARFGGSETLMSYGIQPPRSRTQLEAWESVCAQLNAQLPASHRAFLSGLSLYETIGDYVFVHAGLRPGQALWDQSEADLLWIREDFLEDNTLFDQVVVHGHTPIETPHADHRRIGIDTGAYLTGKLTAACLTGSEVTFLST